jgi:hypothetical protein
VYLVEHDDVVQAVAPNRADEPLRVRFCHGDLAAATTSAIPRPSMACWKRSP